MSRRFQPRRQARNPLQGDPWPPLGVWGFRFLAIATLSLGLYYLLWRYTVSLNRNALWFAIPLLLAETYSLVSAGLFALNLWRRPTRVPPPCPKGLTVDVFITVYNEPPEIVRRTAQAAVKIAYPHRTYILDDGRSPVIEQLAKEVGTGYISRVDNRHAKAGNLNNALRVTEGEFILYLDADQIPEPQILDRTLGYFRDEKVAFVQTPQHFYNVPPGDPFGNDAPLFYGPIQRGKDGWNAAFLCGTNVVLRREALMQMGLIYYVQDMRRELRSTLRDAARAARKARQVLGKKGMLDSMIPATQTLQSTEEKIRRGREALKRGVALSEVISTVAEAEDDLRDLEVALERAREDLQDIAADLESLARAEHGARESEGAARGARQRIERDLLPAMARYESVIREVREAAERVRLAVTIEETPMATISVTEDLATSLRLHALGWNSVYHHEILARGLAPEDLGSALKQRLRWAQGTFQVFFRDNPLTKRGLSLGQRLQYLSTIISYFYGFVTVAYLLSPPVYLLTGIAPVTTYSLEFFRRIVPYLLFNQLMFIYATWGLQTWRGQQYNVALFPIWLRALFSVISGRSLTFAVTPKTRQRGVYLHLIYPQLVIASLTVLAIMYGALRLILGWSGEVTGIGMNIFWGSYNLLMLSAILWAAVWRSAEERKLDFELRGARTAHSR